MDWTSLNWYQAMNWSPNTTTVYGNMPNVNDEYCYVNIVTGDRLMNKVIFKHELERFLLEYVMIWEPTIIRSTYTLKV